jgi:hypothetical protein
MLKKKNYFFLLRWNNLVEIIFLLNLLFKNIKKLIILFFIEILIN